MNKKQYAAYAAIFLVLAVLVYLQIRTWRNFDWSAFLSQTDRVNKLRILFAIGWIYLTYPMRAIRWNIFLRPVRRGPPGRLVTSTIVGFTGLALLGRAGEMIRPYLIARKENLSFSSQMAVWAVERIFDMGAFALLLLSAIAFAPATRALLHFFRVGNVGTIAIGVVAVAFGILMVWKGDHLVALAARRFSPKVLHLGARIALRIREFRSGLNAIHDFWSLLYAIFVSVCMWVMILLAYWEVLQSYGKGLLNISFFQVPLLMLSSMVGSLVALPGVGGGTQLATIFALQRVFKTPQELAASCGILLWLVTFASVIPTGLILAHRERLSLRDLSSETAEAEDKAAVEEAL
ncbi:MAG: lysylphosphatidylglycerol synthase transmembrane domain-containing protein [Terriglobales bacterium]